MMKKAFILTLMVGIASAASAGLDLQTIPGLSYEVNGNTVTISGIDIAGFMFNLAANDASELSNGVVSPFGGTVIPCYGGLWDPFSRQWIGASFSVGTAQNINGFLFSIDFTPTSQTISFVYSSLSGISNIVVGRHVYALEGYSMTVPEPMTMLLLTSGGLLLASRRK